MKNVREMLRDSVWVRDTVLEQAYYDSYHGLPEKYIYRHPSGEVLEVMLPRKTGRLYRSRAEFEQYLQWMQEPHQPTHILEGHMLYGEDFPEHVPQLIDDLARLLKIPRDVLDGSMESLKAVDSAIKKYGKRKSLEAAVFSALVAYSGEVVRQYVQGKWKMRFEGAYAPVWEPWIVDPQDRYCTPFIYLYEDLAEKRGTSLASSMSVALNGRRKLPKASARQIMGSFTFVLKPTDQPQDKE